MIGTSIEFIFRELQSCDNFIITEILLKTKINRPNDKFHSCAKIKSFIKRQTSKIINMNSTI